MSEEDFELAVRRGTGRGWTGTAVAALVVGAIFRFAINGLDYVKLGAGSVALLFAGLGMVGALRGKTRGNAGFSALVALGGAAMIVLSGVVRVDLGALFRPSVEEMRGRLATSENLTEVEVTDLGGGRYAFRGRRGFELCSGETRVSGDSTNTFTECGLPRDLPGLEAACQEGSVDACAIATERLHDEAPIDWPRLNVITARGCGLGARVSCFYSGVAHELGEGREVDLAAAVRDYRRGCELGNRTSCSNAGLMTFNGRGTDEDHAAAARLWELACDQNDPRACEMLGECYRDGDGVEQDLARAGALFERACNAEDGVACTNFGALVLGGRIDGTEDPARAFTFYERGCEHGSMGGCRLMAVLLSEGRGVEVDPARALALYRRACEGDDRIACLDGGLMLHEGRGGTPPDREAALASFERACRLGHGIGCRNVGVYHRDGVVVARNRDLAREHFEHACELGDQPACREVR